MPFQYNKILVIGATSGIGWGLAERFVKEGSKVIVSGRRQEKLNDFVKQQGSDKASAEVFDITKLDEISSFVAKVTKANPDLDAVLLNSGTQVVLDFSKPETVDIGAFSTELLTNYTSFVALTKGFLPFLSSKGGDTGLIYTSSSLGIVPANTLPSYSATKAAMHSFLLSLRYQLRDTKVKIVEIFPPVVQTELHDYMPNGRNFGMPLQDFTDAAYKQLEQGEEEVIVNNRIPHVNDILEYQHKGFDAFAKIMAASH